jgi:hypothetical protein
MTEAHRSAVRRLVRGRRFGAGFASEKQGDTLPDMYIGLGVFAVLAVVCVFAGAAAMKRRRQYGDSDADGEMGEAEFRKYEGFDE